MKHDDHSNIPEAFFHYLWKYRMFSRRLFTGDGEPAEVIHPGTHNSDAGPDFLCARVRIGDTLWAGNVEIHVRASDWLRHGHHRDGAYNNVILHVVAENDAEAITSDGKAIPTLVVGNAFSHELLECYREIIHNLLWIPCERMIGSVGRMQVTARLNATGIGRLHEKAEALREELMHLRMDWEECCYRALAGQFGARLNRQPFLMLARSLPSGVVMKYRDNPFQLEALFLGQSGLLNTRLYGKYPNSLKREHAFLAQKHGLAPVAGYLWKFMRMRPSGFPTIRLALLAALYSQAPVFRRIIDAGDLRTLTGIFSLEASPYWTDHFLVDRKSSKKTKRLGMQSIHTILINAAVPMIYLYGEVMNRPDLCARALDFLEEMPPEDNAVVRKWRSIGVKAFNSLETQGLIQLKSSMCDRKACLECNIGHHILRQQL